MTFRPNPPPGAPANPPVPRVVSVKALAEYLKRKLEADGRLRNISVRGEISNLSAPSTGNLHFDLKEGADIVHCFAWASDAARFPPLRQGVAVVVRGAITTYAPRSLYQLVVNSVTLDGIGDVHALFEERKRKLAAEGVFDPARKRPLPGFPFRVALVSSRGASGAVDFVTILHERAPHVRVVWCETLVQGAAAPQAICAALRRASAADVDLIVVTRGGGSFEDLFAFSDESVVRAVARARHPVLSAIGHTADQQLCDFAADAHVETPSAAAKVIGLETRELRGRALDALERGRRAAERSFERLQFRLTGALVRSKLAEPRSFLAQRGQRLDELDASLAGALTSAAHERSKRVRDLVRRLDAHDPTRRLADRAVRLGAASLRLESAARQRTERAGRLVRDASRRLEPAVRAAHERIARRVELVGVRLDGNSPETLLQRGYAIVTYRGTIVRDPLAVPPGALIEARVARGTLSARVERWGQSGGTPPRF